jgi:ribosomal protein S18 acetylase RimI-like enzyme
MGEMRDGAVSLREARADEAEALAALVRAAFEEYRGVLDPPSSAHAQTAANLAREMADGAALVAEADGAPVGCVLLHPRGDHLYVDRLAVHPAWRGRGIAGLLVAAAEARARAAGLPACRLSVRLSLAENRAWYERLGYAQYALGTHAGYAAPTYVTLEKRLSPDG